MRYVFLVLLAIVSFEVLAAMPPGKHGSAQSSLLPECQLSGALPSPHCGKVPTVVFGEGDSQGILYVVFEVYFLSPQDE